MPELTDQLKAIEVRLAKIESVLNVAAPSSVLDIPEIPDHIASGKSTYPQSTLSSISWLAIVAVICFVLAAGFIIKLSMESGWLTPLRQIGLAFLFGVGLIGSGLLIAKTDKNYASYLPAAGIIILYLAAFAAHRFYHLISIEMAIADISIISGLCIWLYTVMRNDIYPLVAAAGSYLAPTFLDINLATVFSLYYFIICSLAFSTISIWLQSRLLTIISAYLAISMSANIGLDMNQDGLIVWVLAAQFFIFSVGSYIYSVKNNRPLTELESWGFFPVLLLFYATEYYFIDRIHPGIAPWISLLFAGFLLALYCWAAKRLSATENHLGSQAMILAFATLVGVHSIYLELIPIDFHPWLFVIICFAGALFPVNSFLTKGDSKIYFIPIVALIIILANEYITMISHLIDGYHSSWMGVSLAALVSLWFVLIMQQNVLRSKSQCNFVLLVAAHFLAIMAFYQLTYKYNSLAVSASWLLYALGVIAFAYYRQDKVMAKSALLVLSLAASKALLYDTSSAATGLRIVCLLVTGAALYGAGFMLRKIDRWK